MTPAPQPVPRAPRRHVRLRVLVLLLALLLPGAHAEAYTGVTAPVPAEHTTVECDLLDTAPRPAPRAARRVTDPPAPALPTGSGPTRPARRSTPVPPSPPHDPRPLRSEVLRC
ncbi:hypothetical protein ACIQU3_09720 [Streptomyces sp. NPDC101110]|uniref:hypothetical protein n=1 Tax=Streptomyces sp. NPDC101110 TaxID=3366104 RepID=UPI003805DA8B